MPKKNYNNNNNETPTQSNNADADDDVVKKCYQIQASVVILFPLKFTYLNIKIDFNNKKKTVLEKSDTKTSIKNICLLFYGLSKGRTHHE